MKVNKSVIFNTTLLSKCPLFLSVMVAVIVVLFWLVSFTICWRLSFVLFYTNVGRTQTFLGGGCKMFERSYVSLGQVFFFYEADTRFSSSLSYRSQLLMASSTYF